ncbi:SusC/RagA family TonB-linked outer membrane protein [Flavobacterium sp.]|uniref:SusC/RagA family TonB-linked outer membrane protein n=1 Tax=Flavobacterium sp. TaxID=239 RepID=UPI0037529FB6
MKNSIFKCLIVFLTMLCSSFIHSQSISGTVSDNNGPLPGASVLVKGTTNGAQTNFDGSYSLKNVGANAVLVFSYMGFKTQEVNVSGKSTINVVLVDEASKLSEVVVIGYGTVKKKDATGAVDQISSKKFDNVAANSPAEILRGKLAGVQVTSSSGEPGAGMAIRIRGNSSVRAGNDPLVVVDGVPLAGGDISSGGGELLGTSSSRNPLSFINQNDVESISVLKDASSTAIYGSRGANGVILITTKKGRSKSPELTYNSSVGFSSYKGGLDVLSGDEFAKLNPAKDGGSRVYDWKKDVLRSGITTNNDVSFSSGNEKSTSRLSFGAINTEGIVKNTGLDKYTATLYNSNDYFDGILKVDSRIAYSAIKDKGTLTTNNAGFVGNVIGAGLYYNPTFPIYDNSPDGYFNPNNSDKYLNPVQILDGFKDYTNTSKIFASITSSVKITNKLKYQFLFGVEYSNSSRKRQLLPSISLDGDAEEATRDGVTKKGLATISNQSRFNKTFEHTLNYNISLGKNVDLDAVAGFSYYDYNADSNEISAKGFNADQINLIDNIEGAFENSFRPNSSRNRSELQSFFGRANLSLFKNLLLTGTLRQDGSTRPGENYKRELFPSAAIAYKIFDGKSGLVNSLKLRASYGRTGNQEFKPNSALFKASYGNNGSPIDQTNANPNLKWETTSATNFGLDFSIIKDKLSGSVDYFQSETKDLIFNKPQDGFLAANVTIVDNLDAILEKSGVEASLTYNVISNENVSWNISGNVAILKNKIRDLAIVIPAGGINGQGLSGAYSQILGNNLPIYTYNLNQFVGYDGNGDGLYLDDDGKTVGLGFATKRILDKQATPKINIGFSTSFSYKKFDTSTSFYGSYGHFIYNNTANAQFFKGAFLNGEGKNVPSDVANSVQSRPDPNSASTRYLEKGDFLRMGSLTLGYTFTGAVWERARIKSARFYITGENLLLFTDYSGFDPEVDTDKTLNGVPSAGIDYLSYPKAKTISFGLNLTL